jgi:hypothetical protein
VVAGGSVYAQGTQEMLAGRPQVRAVIGGSDTFIGARGHVTTTRNADGTWLDRGLREAGQQVPPALEVGTRRGLQVRPALPFQPARGEAVAGPEAAVGSSREAVAVLGRPQGRTDVQFVTSDIRDVAEGRDPVGEGEREDVRLLFAAVFDLAWPAVVAGL